MSNETSRTAESSASCSCSVTVLSFRSRSASSSRAYASVRRAESRAGASGESGDASKVGRCKRSRHKLCPARGLAVVSTSSPPPSYTRRTPRTRPRGREPPPRRSIARARRGRARAGPCGGGRGQRAGEGAWASSETAPAGPREEGSRFETHHAASESMFPLGTRERVPAGGMPPRGLGDRRDGALLARTEECARAGLVPPDGKRSHIIYETERARRFVGTDRRSSSRPSSPATRHGTAFLSQERRVSTRRP